jgi:4-hydroxymandelate oxidase
VDSNHLPVEPLSVDGYETAARHRLPADVWDYVAGGAGTESTLSANRAALRRRALRPRFLVDVSTCDPSVTVLGARLAAPLGVAPIAYHRLVHPDGEVATARAAGQAGALFVVSPFASRSIEDIAAASSGPLWLQLYWLRRREVMVDLIRRAEAAGYGAIVLTVDTPRLGRRLRDVRNGFAVPPGIAAVNIGQDVMATAHDRAAGGSALERHSREQFDPTLSWSDLAWLRGQTGLPLLLKGILTAEDARLAVAHGAAGVIVSNHGGRQLDQAVSTIDALPEVAEAVSGECPVLVDGGFRTGTEVLIAIALGATVVLLGRPVLWGLACHGERGAHAVLRTVADELADAMTLSGRPRLAHVDSSMVRLTAG